MNDRRSPWDRGSRRGTSASPRAALDRVSHRSIPTLCHLAIATEQIARTNQSVFDLLQAEDPQQFVPSQRTTSHPPALQSISISQCLPFGPSHESTQWPSGVQCTSPWQPPTQVRAGAAASWLSPTARWRDDAQAMNNGSAKRAKCFTWILRCGSTHRLAAMRRFAEC
jgi:hypothetical protein